MIQDNSSSSGSTTQGTATLVVRVEHRRDAFGIGADRPRLSWTIGTKNSNWYQAGYEIAEYDAEGGLIQQTGRVESRPICVGGLAF